MSPELDEALTRLADGIATEDAAQVQQVAQALRQQIAALLAEARLEPEDALLAQRRRLHHRLEVIEAKAGAGRFEDAEEDREDVAPLARELAEAIRAREPTEEKQARLLGLRRAWVLAKREARARWRRVGIVAVLALLVLALAVQAREGATSSLLALASLGGAVAAAGVVSEDAETGRLHLVVGHGTSRASVVAAKLIAIVALLAIGLAAAGIVAVLASLALGIETSLVAAAIWGLAFVLLAGAFASLVVALEVQGLEAEGSLAAGAVIYLVLGPVWRSAFLAGAGAGGALASAGAQAVYLASPVAGGRRVLEAGGTLASAAPGLLVLLAWVLLAASVAAVLAHRRGLASATGEHN